MVQLSSAAVVGSTGTLPGFLPTRALLKRIVTGLALLSGITAAASYGHQHWTVGQLLGSTDEARQVLARIDDRDFRTALDQAQADVAAAEAAIGNLDAQLVLQRSVIDQERADIAATEATLKFAQKNYVRYRALLKRGYARAGLVAAQNKIDVLVTERMKAMAERERARAIEHQVELILSQLDLLQPELGL